MSELKGPATDGYSIAHRGGLLIHVWPDERCLVLEQDGEPVAMRAIPSAIEGKDLTDATREELERFWALWAAWRTTGYIARTAS